MSSCLLILVSICVALYVEELPADFLKLEGAGAGGRAIMFRCSNLDAVKKLANSKSGLKHGSPLGNDMFKAQLLKRSVVRKV
jgi:hypothetical protein